MSGKFIDRKSNAITGIGTDKSVVIASTTGYYKGATVWVVDSGNANAKECLIFEVTDATHLKLLFKGGVGEGPRYGYSDATAYNGGIVTQLEQLVYNTNEVPLA